MEPAVVQLPTLTALNQPPTINLIGPSEVEISAGDAYVACTRVSELTEVCDQGAKAFDAEDGNLDLSILACGSSLQAAGLGGCSTTVDTSKAGTYDVTFSVTDSSNAVATAVRRLVVHPRCEASCCVRAFNVGWFHYSIYMATSEHNTGSNIGVRMHTLLLQIGRSKQLAFRGAQSCRSPWNAQLVAPLQLLVPVVCVEWHG